MSDDGYARGPYSLVMCNTLSLAMCALLAGVSVVPAQGPQASDGQRPNIVLIIADDCTASDMEVYGGQAKTPHLARLARQGMRFSRCFQAAPMCSPTRHALYTGLYPVKSGAWPNHTRAYDWVKSLPHYLNSAGYRCHLSGKTHIAPKSVFPFEYSRKKNNPDAAAIDAFLGACAKDGTPFLLVAASNEPHSPWTRGDASVYPPAGVELPPVLVDTSRTRELFSRYLAEITYFDSQVGTVLRLLDKHDVGDDTLVIVLSEQGNSFPFAKWTCYENGLRSGLVVRWPGKVKPRSESGALVEYVDVVPTLLEAIGRTRPDVLDGASFLAVLTGEKATHKDFVFGLQTSRGISNGPEHYGIRSVRGVRYRLIRNLTPDAMFQNNITELADKFGWASWERAAAAGDLRAKRLTHDFQRRPAEELYDCEADPYNRTNLIANPELAATVTRLRNQLDGWMKSQGDGGQETELRALERSNRRRGKNRQKRGG